MKQKEIQVASDQPELNSKMFELTEESISRYSRNIVLPEIGGVGQKKLLNSKVLIIGAGGLGSPLILYLAAAGVGQITVIDNDEVELSNLQRQIIHSTPSIGLSKAKNACKSAMNLNPNIKLISLKEEFSSKNAINLINSNDIVADGSDNFKTRFITADACYLTETTLVSAAILRFDGQISTWSNKNKNLPCYRCLYSEQPKSTSIPSCSQSGVLGAVAGVLGSLQAAEIIKELLSIGVSLAGFIKIINILESKTRQIKINKDPDCILCSPKATIKDVNNEEFYER